MSMSTHIEGFKPPDATWRKHFAVWDACTKAGVTVPSETRLYFSDEAPDNSGVTVDLYKNPAVKEYRPEGRSGWEVDLTRLPKDVTIIRFFNSW